MGDSRSVESWTWYAFATLVVVLRYISRAIRLDSWWRWEIDDYVMVLAFGFYTNLIVWVNIQKEHPHTNILPPTGLSGLTEVDIEDRIYGSKITFVIEESMVMVQSLCKLCMCLLYYKLTSGLHTKRIWVNLVLGYVILGWFIVELFFFGIWCRPFLNYFRVLEDNSPSCTTAQRHLIMSYTFNISSDVFLLLVPIPILLQAQLPLKRKLILGSVFSMGIFVIISATLSRYYCFAKPESILWIFWYVREASTAIIVVNMPHLYALLRYLFHLEVLDSLVGRTKRSWYGRSPSTSDYSDTRHSSNASSFMRLLRRSTSSNMPTNHTATTMSEKDRTSFRIVQRTEYSVTSVDAATEPWDFGLGRTVIQGGCPNKQSGMV